MVSPALLTLVLLTGNGAPAATPLELLWNLTPPPFKSYVDCGAAAAGNDFCVTPGPWVGFCALTPDKPRELTVVAGALELASSGEVHLAGCEEPRVLLSSGLAQRAGVKPGTRPHPVEACISGSSFATSVDGQVALFNVKSAQGRVTVERTVRPQRAGVTLCAELRQSSPTPPESFSVDPGFAPGVRLGEWHLQEALDLDGDGQLELLLSSHLTDFAPADAALLVRLQGSSAQVLARTAGVPRVHVSSPSERALMDVQQAKDACEHWGGEDATDAARKKQIQAGQQRDCATYKRKLAAARKHFPSEPALRQLSADE